MITISITEFWHKYVFRKDESDWDFGIPDDQWWNTVVEHGEPKHILIDDEEYICGIYEHNGTHHLLGFSDGIPLPDRQNAWFDVSFDDAKKVMEFMMWKRQNYHQKKKAIRRLFGFLSREDWESTIEKYSDTSNTTYIDLNQKGGDE